MKLTRHPDKLGAVAIAIFLVAGFLWSQKPQRREGHQAAAAGPPLRVSVTAARSVTMPRVIEGIGTVRSRQQTLVASRVLAEVREIHRQAGEAVAAGEPLVSLDDKELKANLEQAEARLVAAAAAAELARTELARVVGLLGREAATRQEHEVAVARYAEAAASMEAAQKARLVADLQRSYATLAAPFAGVVLERHADPGDLATPGKPLLALYDPEALRLETLVDEGAILGIKVNEVMELRIDTLGTETLRGKVSEVVPAVDPVTRTGTVKIDLPRRAELRPGMFGRAYLPAGSRPAVVVPASAIVRRGQLEIVFVAEATDAPANLVARMTLVRSGERVPASIEAADEPWTEITSGLQAGLEVITRPPSGLRDGVQVENAPRAGDGKESTR